MPLYLIIILALVQGLTEFLPISSSGHLALIHAFTDKEASQAVFAQNLLMDVAVHVGTLLAVLLYFHRDVLEMLRGAFQLASGNAKSNGARMNIHVIVASLPVIAAGFAMHHYEFFWGHALEIIGWTSLVFGILLWVVDAAKPVDRTLESMTFFHALMIGLAQAVALIPGTSRSGITMTAARYFGYTRTDAARFSLLLAIVAIAGAGLLETIKLIEMDDVSLTLGAALGAATAFISGLLALHLMMKWLERADFKIFAIYRIILGIALLALVYSGTIH